MTWSARYLVLCTVLVASSCREGRGEEEERIPISRVDEHGRVVLTQEEREALGLETAAAAEGSLSRSTLRFGKVIARPQEDALVIAPLTGRLVTTTLALGARVTAGEVLLALEPLVDTASHASLQAQRRELQGQFEAARALVEAKRSDLSRVATLVSSGLATEADKAQAEAALTSEQARMESLRRASGELARMAGGRVELRSPASGVLATLATETGALIQQGTVLARVVRTGPRWIDVAVPPGDPVGSGYRAQAASGAVDARLLSRGAVIQPDGTRRDRLEASPEGAADLPPGATVPVEVLHESRGILVPASALVRRGREALVFVEVADGRFEARAIEVVARDETRAVAASGLSGGERVVTRGASSLLGELGTGDRRESAGAQR